MYTFMLGSLVFSVCIKVYCKNLKFNVKTDGEEKLALCKMAPQNSPIPALLNKICRNSTKEEKCSKKSFNTMFLTFSKRVMQV